MTPNEIETIRKRALNISGEPVFVFGGEFHYFRIPHTLWKDRLRKAKGAFLNLIGSYIPWGFHEAEEGKFSYDDLLDIRYWCELLKETGLYFFARPGPYICSESDMGGLPAWLLGKGCLVRTTDPEYMASLSRWYSEINSILCDFLPENGGTLVIYQVENEFVWGEREYFRHLARAVRRNSITVPLITNLNTEIRDDPEIADSLDLYPTPWYISKTETCITDLLHDQPKKLTACPEFQMGFVAEVGTTLPSLNGTVPPSWVEVHTKNTIARGLNFLNYYMFSGGTTFGYRTGRLDISSYDLDTAIREWGELSEKYYMARRIGSFLKSFGSYLVKTLPTDDIEVVAPRGVSVLQRRGEDFLFVFPRNLTQSPQEVSFTVNVPDGMEITIPSSATMRLGPQSMKMLPVNVPLNNKITLLYSTSEIFGLYSLSGEIILLVHGEPGQTGEVVFEGFDNYDHFRGKAAVNQAGKRLIVTFLHEQCVKHIRLMCEQEGELIPVAGGIRIIVADTETASKTWPGKCENDIFPILSDIYFMDEGEFKDDILKLPVSIEPDRAHFLNMPCYFNPLVPVTVSLNGKELKVTENNILKSIGVHIPPIPAPETEKTIIKKWKMRYDNTLNLLKIKGWKTYSAFQGNERSGQYEAGYYSYRCNFTYNSNPGGKILFLTEIHDNADVYLNGTNLGGCMAEGNNGSKFSAGLEDILRRGKNELFVLVENEGRPRKGDDATFTGITGPVVITGEEEKITLIEWKRGRLTIESESLMGAVPPEAGTGFDDSVWEQVEIRPGWDSRLNIPPSSNFIEYGHERIYAVYRTYFELSDIQAKKGIILDVGQVDGKCWVYLNDKFVDKKHQHIFTVDLTPNVHKGKNILTLIMRNFRWAVFLGLHKSVIIRIVDNVLKNGWKFIRGSHGQLKGWQLATHTRGWKILDRNEAEKPVWLTAAFETADLKNWTAPLGLTLKDWNAKILIYLNGFLAGRYHPQGPQEVFYLPEDHLKKHNRITLFCNAHGDPVKIGSAEISPYYMVKEGILEVGF